MTYFALVVYLDGDELLDAEILKADTLVEMIEEVRERRKKTREVTDGNASLRAYSIPRLVALSAFTDGLGDLEDGLADYGQLRETCNYCIPATRERDKVKISPEDGSLIDNWASKKTLQHFPSLIRIYKERLALEEQRKI